VNKKTLIISDAAAAAAAARCVREYPKDYTKSNRQAKKLRGF
jgi:hypothetical protein